ncbi:MAG: class I SAM-dependent methyltransferase [bacterium]|nr:class I SAM-dependent methyltransferase [bacterium]
MNWTGLAALAWDPSGGDETQWDFDFIKAVVEQGNGPALDVGCGTGRLLIRYMQAGLDVDGVDTSADMLELCREKAAKVGLQPNLYQQGMQALDLPRQYQTIFVPCGSFCLVIDRAEAQETLRRFHAHLLPGGTLLFNLFWQFGYGEPLSDQPPVPIGEWRPLHQQTLPDGRRMEQTLRRDSVDRWNQVMYASRRYQLFDGDALVAEEIFPANERWYFQYELLAMLQEAGFHSIQIKGDYTDAHFHDGKHSTMVILAQK